MTKIKFEFTLTIIAVILLTGCQEAGNKDQTGFETFNLYVSKDTFIIDQDITRQVPVVDRIITIEKHRSVLEKINIIADSLSFYYFNNLAIEISRVHNAGPDSSIIVIINLIENDDYNGPGTLPLYQSWYDFFQGSYGGLNTQITLEASLLQKNYSGPWIKEVRFLYQNDPIEEWDHINLSVVRIR